MTVVKICSRASFTRVAETLSNHWTRAARVCASPLLGLSSARTIACSAQLRTLSVYQAEKMDSMLRELLSQETKEAKLSHAMKICAFTKQHSIKPWLLGNEMREFYEVLSSDLRTHNVEGIIAVMKCLHPRDPIVESMAKMLRHRKDELDFHDCMYLVHLSVQAPKLVNILKAFYASLRRHLTELMEEDAELSGPEVMRAVSLLMTVRHYSMEMSDLVGAYLARHLHRLDMVSVHGLLWHVARGAKRHGIKCNQEFVTAVGEYFLELLNKCDDIEERTQCWGESYGFYFSRFLRFYGSIKFYEKEICERIKEIFLGPYDRNIHNPIVMSSLAYMCGEVFYYDEDLLEYLMQLSYNQVESFHLKELAEMLLAFQSLNFDHSLFLNEVVEVTLKSRDVVPSCELYWSVINSSIFSNTYNHEVLARFLTDNMMEGMLLFLFLNVGHEPANTTTNW